MVPPGLGSQVPVPDPGSAQLSGVAAISATDAWAVGSYVTNGVTQNLTEHWRHQLEPGAQP
jgi:hypothetical protein